MIGGTDVSQNKKVHGRRKVWRNRQQLLQDVENVDERDVLM